MGTVYLVGGGAGDPGLLAVRGAELLARAEVIVCDARINPAIIEQRAPSAKVVRLGELSSSREEITRVLIEAVRGSRVVVRLTDGDPLMLGRGGEEALALRNAGVRFEVVPGIPAVIAAPVYAGIPLTHRGLSESVTFVSGCEPRAEEENDPEWNFLAHTPGTVVLEAAAGQVGSSIQRLIEVGVSLNAPAAVTEWGSDPRQRTVQGTLESLPGLLGEVGGDAPAIVVVGDVVRLRDELAWFETRPLFGRRIVVTRPRAQAGDFAAALEGLGAQVIPFPTIRITDPRDPEPLRRAAADADGFGWIVFTSVNGVERFWQALRAVGRDTRSLAGVSLCAIGPATGAAIELEGARPDLIPDRFVAEAVVEALRSETELSGIRILLPRAEVARDVLPDSLRVSGAEVEVVAAYRTVPDAAGAEDLQARLSGGGVDLITFTASSTVRNFVDAVGTGIGNAQVASIGPITTATARELGLPVHVEATEYTIPGLLAAIQRHYAEAIG